jgi:hypothetical protein
MTDFDEIRQHMDLLPDDELVSILQEHDEEQWRPEVFDIVKSILNGRGISSVDAERGTGVEEDDAGIPDAAAGQDLVTVGNYTQYVDAETDRMALEVHGMNAWIFNQYGPPMEGFGPAVQLKVLEEDLAAAMHILESKTVASFELPAEIAEPPCPKCGSRQVAEKAEIVEFAADSSPKQVWFYNCAACGYKWSHS